MKTFLPILLAYALISVRADGASTDFEDLTLQTVYGMGSTFTSQGLSFEVVPFTTGTSAARVGQSGYAAGSGKEIFLLNRAGLEFQLDAVVSEISFRYGEFCCHSGVSINGVTTVPTIGLVGLHGMTIGGGTFAVTSSGAGNDQGLLTVTGSISSFTIGGTEFAIDDVTVLSHLQPGDFDFDGDVDGRDFLVWQRGGSPDPLSSADLLAWQTNYASGNDELSTASTAIPEPGTSALLIGAALAIVLRHVI